MSTQTPKLVFMDLETGGIDPKRHPIIQVAAIATDIELNELESLELKVIFEEAKATKYSLRKSQYSRSRWSREAIQPADAARRLSAFLRRHATAEYLKQDGSLGRVAYLAAHNASFDTSFLRAWMEKLGVYLPASFHVACTMQRAIWWFAEHSEVPRPDNLKLQTLCRYFNVPLHSHEAHDALADVRATIGLYRALRQGAPSVASTPQPLPLIRRMA